MRQTRNPIQDIWRERNPFEGENRWPVRVDEYLKEQPERWVQSACLLCSHGCALDVGVKDGKIVGVRGRETDRVNRGRLGPKGMCGWQANSSKDRLTRPLIQENGSFREASWDEAMNRIVARCRETIEKYSSDAVGFYNTGQLFLEEYYTLSMLAYAGIGTNHVDGNTRLCTATASQALRETLGHDLETGAARTAEEYRANDPQGRALLKAANYITPLEEPDDEYPFFLNTGRIVYHFHTRTKTGRSPELQQAAPDVFVQIAQEDAEKLSVKEGDELEITSRRGTVRGAARIGNIAPGNVFIPFHYGYWDRSDGHHRAANELTISGWDPVSKQPHFKYAAVQVKKAGASLSNLGHRVRDAMSKTLDRTKEAAHQLLSGSHPAPRSHVPDALGLLQAQLGQFAQKCRSLKEVHFEELELISTWETLALWCDDLQNIFAPFTKKYGEEPAKEPETLRQTLFPAARTGDFGVLRDLQSLDVFAAALHGTITVLFQAAQGLRDGEMLQASVHAQEQIKRMQAWIMNQIKHRTVSSLVIPS